MTVANNYQPVQQTGNGTTTAFSFNFKVNVASQIKIYEKVGTGSQEVVDPSEYSVSLTNSGGMVTFNTAPVDGAIIVITRDTPQTQETPYKTSQGFPAEVVESDFDKLTMIVQELQYDSARSVKVTETSSVDPDELTAQVERIYTSIDNVDTVADNIANVNTVSGISADVSTVAGNTSNINTVAGISSDVTTTAGISANVTAVAGNATNVNTVAGISSDVTTVAGISSNVTDVAGNETNINTVAGISGDVTTTAGIASDVSAVADIDDEVTAVAGNATNINTVAGISSDVTTVAGIATNVTMVAGMGSDISDVLDNETNINTVATNISDVNTVAGISSDVTTTAGISSDVTAVAGNATNVNTVAGIASDVSAVAAIDDEVTAVAGNATNINNVAADLSSINAVAGDLANIDTASSYAAEAKQWAIGDPTEPSGGSAKYWAGQAAGGQVQADWTEADPTSKAYILNKPTGLDDFIDTTDTTPVARALADGNGDNIANTYAKSANLAAVATSGAYADLSGQPTKLSDFTNDLPVEEGIPVSVITNKKISINGSSVSLYWEDPADTIIDGFVLASWKSTTIVKKQGSAPENVSDGTVVVTVTTRNQYANTPYVDIQDNADQWYYRAFPLSVNGVYSLDKRNVFGTVLFGYRINKTDPVPGTRVEYLPYCDNYFYDPCVMNFAEDKFYWGSWEKAFFIPKPCLLSTSGVVTYYLDPNNFNYQADGVTASNVTSNTVNGNFMVEFPSIFVKVWDDNNYVYCLVSNQKLDDDFECWATKQSDGTYADNFYLPMFEGTVVSSVMRSYASNGKPTASTTAENEATYATANGTGWNTTTWADEMLMMLLFPLLFKSTDSQGTLGYGGTASSSALTVNNDAAITKGMMYGTSGASSYGVTYLGMHNWWGHRWRRPNGLMNANGNYMFKMTHSTIDGSTTTGYNRTASGYISSGVTPPAASSSYINYYQPIGKYGIVPEITSGSATTYYCDGMWTNNGQLDQLVLGGDVYDGTLDGVFCFDVSSLPSYSAWTIGASLSYHHL